MHAGYVFAMTMMLEVKEGEGVMDLAWHPTAPVLVVATTDGLLYQWSAAFPVQWSSYDPHFKDLEQNQLYREDEEEFDVGFQPPQATRGFVANAETDESLQIDEESSDYLASLPICPDRDTQTHSRTLAST
jgi:hypothetical protein